MNEATASDSEATASDSEDELVDFLDVLNDSLDVLSMKNLRMNVARHAVSGQLFPYKILEGALPAILPKTPTSTRSLFLKDAILVAMSVNNKFIAYVTNHQVNNTKTLLVGELTKTEETVNFTILARIGLTGIYSMQDRTMEDKNGGYFISVSSTGNRIVLSSMYGKAKKSTKAIGSSVSGKDRSSDVESAQTVGRQHFSCLVFKVSNNSCVDVDKKIIQERPFANFQGRAAFLKDDKLALINNKVMTVYDPNDRYKKVYWMNLRSLKSSRGLNNWWTRVPFLNPGWAQPIYQSKSREEDNYMKLLHMTRYITQGFLATYNMGVAQVWSAKGTGTQLISLADDEQEIAGISGDGQFAAKMSKKSEYLGIYHTKTGLLVNRLTQRKIAGVEFDPEQAHYAYFCSKHHFLLWISFKTILRHNQIYISFELWNISSEILVSCQEVVAPLLFTQGWRVEPWVIEQDSQSFVPKFQVYYSTYEGDGAIAFRSITIDAYTPRRAMVRIIQQQTISRAQGTDNAHKSTNSQTIGDMNIPEASGSTQNENNNSVDGDGSLRNIKAGDFQNISWCLESVPKDRAKNHSFYEHYQVENALNDHDGLICYKMDYHGIKYLLRLGTRTVQLWRLPTPFEEEQLLYIRAVKPASEPFTQDYDYKWIRSIQDEYSGSDEDLTASAKALQPSEHGRIEIRICSEEHVDEPDYATKSYLDVVHLPLEELMQSEIDLEKWKKAQGKLPANAYNIQQTSSHFQFKCVQYHYIESACQSLHYLCIYPKTKELKLNENQEKVENLVRKTIKIVESTIKEMQEAKSNYFTTISGSSTLAMLASFDIGREILFDILETEALPISLFSYVRHNAKTEQRDERITRKENALTVLIEKLEYDLYYLLLNRLVLHSKKLGIGSFSALTDTLVFLQSRGAQGKFSVKKTRGRWITNLKYRCPREKFTTAVLSRNG